MLLMLSHLSGPIERFIVITELSVVSKGSGTLTYHQTPQSLLEAATTPTGLNTYSSSAESFETLRQVSGSL